MSLSRVSLTDEQIEFVRLHQKNWGARRIAEHLGVPRKLVEQAMASAPPAVAVPPDKKILPLILVLIFAATFFVFSNTLGHKFVWDDWQFVVKDHSLENFANWPKEIAKPLGFYGAAATQTAGSLWRPVVTSSFFADTFFWGKTRPWGYHLTNVLLHCLVALLFFLFLRRFVRSPILAGLGTLLYALHPVQSEAVSSINGRGTPFSGLFVLSAFLLYPRYLLLSCLSLFAALLSKETAVTFFAVILLYDHLIENKNVFSRERILKNYLPFIFVTGAYFAARFLVLGGLGSAAEEKAAAFYTWPRRIWAQPLYFWEYFKMIFLPAGLHPQRQVFYPKDFFDARYFFPFLAFLASLAIGWTSYKSNKKAFFGYLWFLVFLLPVLNLLVVVNGSVMEHWLYLPLMGFVLCLLCWVDDFLSSGRLSFLWVWLASAVILTAFAFGTYHQNKIWKDDVTLFEYTTRYVKNDPVLYNELGVAYDMQGRKDAAEEAFGKALELDPTFKEAALNLRNTEAGISGPSSAESPDDASSKRDLLETLYDDLEQIDTEDIPDLKEEAGPKGKIYTFRGKQLQDLDVDELNGLLNRCTQLIAQRLADQSRVASARR